MKITRFYKKILLTFAMIIAMVFSTSCYSIFRVNNVETELHTVEQQKNSITVDYNSSMIKDSGVVSYLATSGSLPLNDECIELFSSLYNGSVEINYVPYNRLYESLSLLSKNDNSPDIVKNDSKTFPYGIYNNYFEKLDEFIDLDSEVWIGMKDMAEKFKYKGNIYYVPQNISVNNILAYDYDLFNTYGISDPYEIYLGDDWDWKQFELTLHLHKNKVPDSSGVINFSIYEFVSTTGQKLVDFKDDNIFSNINNGDIDQALMRIEMLRTQGYLSTEIIPAKDSFTSENIAFYSMSINEYEEIMRESESEIRFVPYPKSNSADAKYISGKTEGFLIPKGAKNLKGAVDWIVLNRLYVTNPKNITLEEKQALEGDYPDAESDGSQALKGWKGYMYQLNKSLVNPEQFTLVFENIGGVSFELDSYLDEKKVFYQQEYNYQSWRQNREEYNNKLEEFLKDYR